MMLNTFFPEVLALVSLLEIELHDILVVSLKKNSYSVKLIKNEVLFV